MKKQIAIASIPLCAALCAISLFAGCSVTAPNNGGGIGTDPQKPTAPKSALAGNWRIVTFNCGNRTLSRDSRDVYIINDQASVIVDVQVTLDNPSSLCKDAKSYSFNSTSWQQDQGSIVQNGLMSQSALREVCWAKVGSGVSTTPFKDQTTRKSGDLFSAKFVLNGSNDLKISSNRSSLCNGLPLEIRLSKVLGQ